MSARSLPPSTGPIYRAREQLNSPSRGAGRSPMALVAALGGNATFDLTQGALSGVNLEEALRRSQRRPLDVAKDMRSGGTAFERASVSRSPRRGDRPYRQRGVRCARRQGGLAGRRRSRRPNVEGQAERRAVGRRRRRAAGSPPFGPRHRRAVGQPDRSGDRPAGPRSFRREPVRRLEPANNGAEGYAVLRPYAGRFPSSLDKKAGRTVPAFFRMTSRSFNQPSFKRITNSLFMFLVSRAWLFDSDRLPGRDPARLERQARRDQRDRMTHLEARPRLRIDSGRDCPNRGATSSPGFL